MGNVIAIYRNPHDLRLIQAHVGEAGHALRCFRSAAEALAYLQAGGAADAILLDWLTPVSGGVAFMQDLKALPRHESPVIVQAASVCAAESAEIIRSGAYYRLENTSSPEETVAVLNRALADFAGRSDAARVAANLCAIAGNLASVGFSFRGLKDVREISIFLSSLYPDPGTAVLGIRELMLNAVEHGNLGISYDDKTALIRLDAWENEVERRLLLPEHHEKFASVGVVRNRAAIVLTVQDQGPGFDWSRFMTFDKTRVRHLHGRGIAMSCMASFDDVRFVAPGNVVVCTKHIVAQNGSP